MMRYQLVFLICFYAVEISLAQDDSLSVFRVNPNAQSNSNLLKTGYKNAITLSLSHIARGGPSIAYERTFNNPFIAVYGGYGISFIDFAEQFSYHDNLNYYDADGYSKMTMEKPGKIIEVGVKFLNATVWDNSYIGLGYTFITNQFNRKIDFEYEVINNGARSYNIDYLNNEIKLVLGFHNDNAKRFYLDASLGPGFRLRSFNYLSINEDAILLYGLTSQTGQELIQVENVEVLDVKVWLFASLKVGLRL
jgi:hypothetical protein